MLAASGLGSGAGNYDATRQAVADGNYDIFDAERSVRRTSRQGIQDAWAGEFVPQQATAGLDDYNAFGGV